MAQYPRVTIHLEMTSTDVRNEYDPLFDNPLESIDVTHTVVDEEEVAA